MTGNDGTLKADGLRGHVKAMIVNGGVELTDMSGTIDAAAVNGRVSAKMAQVTGPMRLESTNGRIYARDSQDGEGHAECAFSERRNHGHGPDDSTRQPGRRIRTLESHFNGGGPEIDLRVTNGRISITGVE